MVRRWWPWVVLSSVYFWERFWRGLIEYVLVAMLIGLGVVLAHTYQGYGFGWWCTLLVAWVSCGAGFSAMRYAYGRIRSLRREYPTLTLTDVDWKRKRIVLTIRRSDDRPTT